MESSAERLRIFLVRHLFSPHSGVSAGMWWKILRENGFRVEPPYWPRATFLSAMAPINSALGVWERRRFGPSVAATDVPPPTFIIGHWRSGTTHLQRLLAQDEQFAFPTFYEVLNPHHFLLTEDRVAANWMRCLPKTRLIDNMSLDNRVPQEDEFAISVATGISPYLGLVFPRRTTHYTRYLTLETCLPEEVERWKAGMLDFVRKLSLKHGRPLVLKSPAHTGRLKLVLDLFPDARFVHIHRDPFEVFPSMRHMLRVISQASCLQRPEWPDLDGLVLDIYRAVYDAYFRERALIPAGRLHEMRFADLERDPIREMQAVYEHLGFDGFAAVRPRLEAYTESIRAYQKNEYTELSPDLRRRIGDAWRPSFDEWGYARDLVAAAR
jgi:hypothetical protein